MQCNMGMLDRTVRVIAAIVIGLMWAVGYIAGIFSIVLLVIAGIFLFTAMLGFCPLYRPFGFTTKRK